GGSVPVSNYPITGLAAPGRHLVALHLLAAVGMTFDPWVRGLSVHLAYLLSLSPGESVPVSPVVAMPAWGGRMVPAVTAADVSTIAGYGQNRSDITARIGYFIFDKLEVEVAGEMQFAHDGINLTDMMKFAANPGVYWYHDAILQDRIFALGP